MNREAMSAENSSTPQERIGPYRLDELLLEQTGCAIFAATHVKRHQNVLLYVLSKLSGDAAERFSRDLVAAKRIHHRAVAEILDSGEVDGYPYVAFERTEGITLERLLKLEGKISAPIACAIIRQAAIGVHQMHECGLLHGGLTPANLLISRDGVVKVLGTAVSAQILDHPSRPDATVSARYLAPEQLSENAEPRSDIYGLGCTLYTMLTGDVPPSCVDRGEATVELNVQELGGSLVSVVRAMMDLDPTKRIQLLTQVVGAMCNWASEENLPRLASQRMSDDQRPAELPTQAATTNAEEEFKGPV